MATVEDYLASVQPGQRAEYERVRAIVRAQVPDVEETISYGMPTFKYRGKYVVYFGAFKKHMTIFPAGYKYTEAEPIPEALLREMVTKRMAELTGP
jgi:uncharacterized protein YdhG (YjbR/CyaY superfamily)